MLIPSFSFWLSVWLSSLSRRVNANSQPYLIVGWLLFKLIKKGEC